MEKDDGTAIGEIMKGLLNTLKGLLNGLSSGDIIIIVLTLVLIFLTCGLVYLAYKLLTRSQGLKKQFPFDIFSIEGLAKRFLPEKLEEYIDNKNQLEKIISDKIITKPRYIIIHGLSGVGKTRMAVEILRQLETSELEEKISVYFAQKSVMIPTVPFQSYRNVAFFLDDLRPSLELSPESYEEEEKLPPFHERLETIINFLKDGVELNWVIITMLSDEYRKLKEKFSGSNFLNKFSIIELEKFFLTEKCSYIKNLADIFKFSINELIIENLAKASDESLKKIRNFFLRKQSEGKTSINMDDIEEFKKILKDIWMGAYSKFSPQEKSIFDALAKLYQFSIPSFLYIVEEFCISIKNGSKLFRRWKLRKVLKRLDGKWLKIKGNRVYCDDSRLFLKSPDDPGFREDLQLVSLIIQGIGKKRKYKNTLYFLLRPVAHELHKYGMYKESISFYDRILELLSRVLPASLEKARSEFLFFKGHAYYSLGKTYWNKANDCYKQSISLYDKNLFAKHALSTLYKKQGKISEAINLLDEIIEADEKDIIAYETKLEILTYNDLELYKAKKTYQDIKGLLRSDGFSFRKILFAELACINLLTKMGELSREFGDIKKVEEHFTEIAQQYEDLIDKIPSGESEFHAIVRNAYGCFLYDVLERREDGITQLEKARKAWSAHEHTLHKLASIYIEQGEENPEEKQNYWEKAKDCLDKILNINPLHYPARLSVAILESRSIDWNKLSESKFWKKIPDVYNKYKEALEPDIDDYPSWHNPRVHHATGCFLWHVEAIAHERDFQNIPSIPKAENELIKSVKIEDYFKETITIPRSIRNHLILANLKIGDYFKTKGVHEKLFSKYQNISQKGEPFLLKAINLCKEGGRRFSYYSSNSYAASYIARVLYQKGEKAEAKDHLKHAIDLHNENWRAWLLLGQIHEEDKEFEQAVKCYKKVTEIRDTPEDYAKSEYKTRSFGAELYKKREYKRALPFLEEFRATNDSSVLKALMESYYALGNKQKAEEVCQELSLLLKGEEERKLRDRALKLGLKCS